MSIDLVAGPRVAVSPTREAVLEQDQPSTQRHPWALRDLRRLVRMLALSGTGLVVAWLVASGTTDLSHQEMAVAGGIVATAVAIAGLSGWLLAGMRAVRELRDEAVLGSRALIARRSVEVGVEVGGVKDPTAAEGLVTADGMTHYHLATCLMVRGKPTRAAGRSALASCPICLPGEPS